MRAAYDSKRPQAQHLSKGSASTSISHKRVTTLFCVNEVCVETDGRRVREKSVATLVLIKYNTAFLKFILKYH